MPPLTPTDIIDSLRGPLERTAGICLQRALEQSDDALFERAQRDETVGVQDRCFDAMRELRLHRRAIIERFEAALDESFQSGFVNRRVGGGEQSGDWTLMGRDEIEEEVAIEGAISRVRHRHGGMLSEIESRLRHVVTLEGSGNDNPFDPEALVHAFTRALGEIDIAIQPRIIVYKLFEQQLLATVGEVYRSLNAELANAGLSAELARMASNSDPASRHAARQQAGDDESEAAGEGPPPASQGSIDSGAYQQPVAGDGAPPSPVVGSMPDRLPPEEQILGVLHQLVAATRADEGTTANDDGGASGQTVAGVLSAIQRSAGRRHSEPLDPTYLKTVLQKGLERRAGVGHLERTADETIDIVSMLFEVILEDERLPGAVEAQFARLQVPVLKVAMTDPDFLASSSHPARRLFNALARAALALGDHSEVADHPVYRNIRAAVERVVEEYRDDLGVFEQVLEAFQSWQWETGHGAIDGGSSEGEAAERQARVTAVREQVTSAVELRLAAAQPEPPEVVDRLLREAWFKVLFITGIKHGVDSELWLSQAQLMDEVIAATQCHNDPAERERIRMLWPDLLQRIQDGLNGVMYNPGAINRFLEELNEAYDAVDPDTDDSGRGAGSESDDSEASGRPSGTPADNLLAATVEQGDNQANAVSDVAAPAEADQRVSEEVQRKVASIPICSWFEFLEDNGERTRACLQARVDGGQRYIFADRYGRRVAEYSIRELVDAMEDGTAAAVEDSALFDRAIESVIGRLRDQATARNAAC